MDCEPNCLTDMNSYTHFIKRTRRIVMEKTMDKIIALAKARGFVYPGSEIYVVLQTHGIMVILVWN